MSFKEPTYEEYKQATAFARIKYNYGLFVTIICWILLALLLLFVITYSRELSANPLIYGADKLDVECHCYNYDNVLKPIDFFVNSTSLFLLDEKG